MKPLALLIGLSMVALGAVCLVNPVTLVAIARHAATPIGLFVVAFVRLVVGVILYSAARFARTPTALRILGSLFILAGIVTPFFGTARAREIVDTWLLDGPVPLRVWGVFVAALGVFIAYTISDSRRTEIRPATSTT